MRPASEKQGKGLSMEHSRSYAAAGCLPTLKGLLLSKYKGSFFKFTKNKTLTMISILNILLGQNETLRILLNEHTVVLYYILLNHHFEGNTLAL